MGVLVRPDPRASRALEGLELIDRIGNIGVYSLNYVPRRVVCGRSLNIGFSMLKRVNVAFIGSKRQTHD